MSSTKISNLPSTSSVSNDDVFIVTQSGVSKKMSVDQLRTLDNGTISDLGDVSVYQWQLAVVTDDINGPGVDNVSIVYSDGTYWRRLSDGTIIAAITPPGTLVISTTAPSVVIA